MLSGLTDLADGYIARRFHRISNLGKILDPVADKLTQAAMLICLFTRFPHVLLLIVIISAPKKQHIKRVTRTDVEEYAEEEIASSFIGPNENNDMIQI